MNLQDRIAQAESSFENIKQKRSEHLKEAEECLQEMHKLQGEWRVLKELEEKENSDEPEVKVEGE